MLREDRALTKKRRSIAKENENHSSGKSMYERRVLQVASLLSTASEDSVPNEQSNHINANSNAMRRSRKVNETDSSTAFAHFLILNKQRTCTLVEPKRKRKSKIQNENSSMFGRCQPKKPLQNKESKFAKVQFKAFSMFHTED